MRSLAAAVSLVFVAAWALLFAFDEQSVAKDAAQSYTAIAKVKHLMGGIVKTQSGEIRKALRDKGPADEKAWESLELSAALIAETAQLLNMGDRAKDDQVWKNATEKLLASSESIVKACAKKDLENAVAAAGAMNQACGECHKVHKK